MPEVSGDQFEKRFPVFEPLAETVERVVDNILARTGKPDYETGLRVLDRGIFGLHKSQMTVIAARPGIGKTSLVCQIAMNLAKQKKKVAFISLEMTKETILERMFCIEKEIPGFELITGKITPDTERQMSKFAAEVSGIPLRIIDDYCHTQKELYTLIDHLEFRPEILILDHLQHIQGISKNRSQWEILTEYLRYLKEIAMRHKISCLILSQINREGDEKPSLATLKGAGGIEEMADHVLLMNQLKEPTSIASGDKTNGNNFKITVAKNRFGPPGIFELYFDGNKHKFFDDNPYRYLPPT